MSFAVVYNQEAPKNCWECPCSVADSKESVFCHALHKHIQVDPEKIPQECRLIDLDNKPIDVPEHLIWTQF